jgi:Cu/Zn superoxide dismutase
VRRITKAVLGGVAGCALILGASQAANSDSGNMTYLLKGTPIGGDFTPNVPENDPVLGPFDQAKGTLRVSQAPDDTATGFKLTVEGIDKEVAGQEFGAHLHTGPCVNGDYADPVTGKAAGSLAGPHYKDGVAPNLEDVEVWFDLIPNDHGVATDDTKKNFVPVDSTLERGEMSIVIHVLPTNTEFGYPTADKPAGYAGDRQACFKLMTPDDWIG